MEEDQLEKVEKFDIMEPINNQKEDGEQKDEVQNETKKKGCCHFPTAYSILLIIEVIVFILTYIIPKGKFATISYSDKKFTIIFPNGTEITETATKEILDIYGVKIPFTNFEKGYITKPISIPNTYERLSGQKTKFFNLFLYPVSGLIESADISFFLMVLGGTISVIVEMKALTNGLYALANILKGKEFLLLCILMVLISIGGTTFGMMEETLAFYPILMPIFLKSKLDGMLGAASLISGALLGTMFSTVNAFAVVIGSYSAGINFTDGIVFRLIGLVIGDALTCGYFYFYYRRIQMDESKSTCNHLKKKLEDKFLKKEDEENQTKENEINDEAASLKSEKTSKEKEKNKFTLIQKFALVIFVLGFVIMIIGVAVMGWWFPEMTAVFFVIGIILMILSRQEEEEAIKNFTKGVGDFAGVSLIIGLARGINITLEDGKISDTILDSLSGTLGNMNKVAFAIVMLLIFLVLGFFIQSSSGLAVLSMPIFAPLADNAKCTRTLVVNAYMFAQNLIGFISPTGILLIVLQIVGIQYNIWVKFIWPYLVILLIVLMVLIMINSAL